MPYRYEEFARKLKKLGFKVVRQKWSHVIFSNWIISFPVPKHWGKEISKFVENRVLKLIWISKEDFKKL